MRESIFAKKKQKRRRCGVRILTISHKLPPWIKSGYAEYHKRLPETLPVELIEIPAVKRSSSQSKGALLAKEGERMLQVIDPMHIVIALDVLGKAISTPQLAEALTEWQQDGRRVDLLIGGADGLAPACLARADRVWSLSALTFPHALVRVIVIEQLYRACTILQNHPYHR